MNNTLYDTLLVDRKSSQEDIKASYRALVKKYHPDIYQGDKDYATERLQKINEAYDTLSDPMKRSAYDVKLSVQRMRSRYSTGTANASQKRTGTGQKTASAWTNTYKPDPSARRTGMSSRTGFNSYRANASDARKSTGAYTRNTNRASSSGSSKTGSYTSRFSRAANYTPAGEGVTRTDPVWKTRNKTGNAASYEKHKKVEIKEKVKCPKCGAAIDFRHPQGVKCSSCVTFFNEDETKKIYLANVEVLPKDKKFVRIREMARSAYKNSCFIEAYYYYDYLLNAFSYDFFGTYCKNMAGIFTGNIDWMPFEDGISGYQRAVKMLVQGGSLSRDQILLQVRYMLSDFEEKISMISDNLLNCSVDFIGSNGGSLSLRLNEFMRTSMYLADQIKKFTNAQDYSRFLSRLNYTLEIASNSGSEVYRQFSRMWRNSDLFSVKIKTGSKDSSGLNDDAEISSAEKTNVKTEAEAKAGAAFETGEAHEENPEASSEIPTEQKTEESKDEAVKDTERFDWSIMDEQRELEKEVNSENNEDNNEKSYNIESEDSNGKEAGDNIFGTGSGGIDSIDDPSEEKMRGVPGGGLGSGVEKETDHGRRERGVRKTPVVAAAVLTAAIMAASAAVMVLPGFQSAGVIPVDSAAAAETAAVE